MRVMNGWQRFQLLVAVQATANSAGIREGEYKKVYSLDPVHTGAFALRSIFNMRSQAFSPPFPVIQTLRRVACVLSAFFGLNVSFHRIVTAQCLGPQPQTRQRLLALLSLLQPRKISRPSLGGSAGRTALVKSIASLSSVWHCRCMQSC